MRTIINKRIGRLSVKAYTYRSSQYSGALYRDVLGFWLNVGRLQVIVYLSSK